MSTNILILKSFEDVNEYFEVLSDEKCLQIAIDIECEMNLHCYGEHLCLIQIYDGTRKVLVDPLAFKNEEDLKGALKLIFENRKVFKIAYDSQSDAMLIEKIYGVKFKSIYDLRPAVTLLEYEKQSLSYILNDELNLPLISKKKFQTYNWMRRPIDAEALNYALSDVIYLFELKDKLMKKIVDKGLLDRYMHINIMAQNKEYEEPKAEDIYKKRKGYSKLSRNSKELFRKLYDTREEFAKKLNKSPNFIIGNDKILELSSRRLNVQGYLERNVSYRINISARKEFMECASMKYREHFGGN